MQVHFLDKHSAATTRGRANYFYKLYYLLALEKREPRKQQQHLDSKYCSFVITLCWLDLLGVVAVDLIESVSCSPCNFGIWICVFFRCAD